MSSMATSIEDVVDSCSDNGVVVMRSVFKVRFLDCCVYSKDGSAKTELMRKPSAQAGIYTLLGCCR